MKHSAVVIAVMVLTGVAFKVGIDVANKATVDVCETPSDVTLKLNGKEYYCFTDEQLKLLIFQVQHQKDHNT